MAGGSAARLDVSVGPASGTPPRTRLFGVFQAFAREGAGGGFSGRRLRPARGRPRPLCAGGKRATDPPGDPLHRPVFEVKPGQNLVRNWFRIALGELRLWTVMVLSLSMKSPPSFIIHLSHAGSLSFSRHFFCVVGGGVPRRHVRNRGASARDRFGPGAG